MSRGTPRRVRKHNVSRVLLTLGIIYSLFVIALALAQRKLIYFPTRLDSNVAERIAAKEGFVPWRDQSGQIIGWKLPASASPTASILIVHGNAGCALDRDYIARPIHDAESVDVFILEYPGYGSRGGSPSKASLCAAAEAAFATLPTNAPIYLVSESIGAGVATCLAGKYPDEIAGLLLFVPFDNLASVAQRKMPIFPAYFILRDRFDPVECLRNFHGPLKIVIAGADEVIPPRSGQRLFDQYQGPKQIQTIPGARHNEVEEQTPEWWKQVYSFWRQNGRTNVGPAK